MTRKADGESGNLIPNRREFLKLTGMVGAGGVVAGIRSSEPAEAMVDESTLPHQSEQPEVRVIATGGTIASTEDEAHGESNLLTAVRMATRREFHLEDEPSGVYLVMNETITPRGM